MDALRIPGQSPQQQILPPMSQNNTQDYMERQSHQQCGSLPMWIRTHPKYFDKKEPSGEWAMWK